MERFDSSGPKSFGESFRRILKGRFTDIRCREYLKPGLLEILNDPSIGVMRHNKICQTRNNFTGIIMISGNAGSRAKYSISTYSISENIVGKYMPYI